MARAHWLPTLILMLLVLAFSGFFAALSVHRHLTFGTAGNDLGNLDQAVWNTSQGRWFESTNWRGGTNRLGAHVEPVLLLLALSYRVASTPLTLLVLQAVVVGLGAVPLFWLARRCLGSDWAALPFALAYLLLPALQAAVLYEFHPLTLTAAFWALAVAGLLERQNVLFVLGTLLAVSCKEDMPLVAIALGLYALLVQRRWWLGGLTIGLAAGWFVVANFVVIPHFNPGGASPYLPRYRELGSSIPEILLTLATQPWRAWPLLADGDPLGYLLALLLPVAFLALLAPEVLILGLPPLAENLLSNSPLQKLPEVNHYPAPIVPFVVAAAIVGTARLAQWSGQGQRLVAAASLLVLVATLGYSRARGFTPLAWDFEVKPMHPHYAVAQRVIAAVPPEASVSATPQLNPHLTQRRQVVVYPRGLDFEVVVLDTWPLNVPLVVEDQLRTLRQLLARDYGLVAAEDGIFLLQRGVPSQAQVEAGYRNQLRTQAPARRAEAAFGDTFLLDGYTLVPEPPSTPHLVLALRAGARPNERDRLFVIVSEGDRAPAPGDEVWQLVGPTFLPPTRWGATPFQALTPTFGRWRRPGVFTVSLVATDGGSPWDRASRLPLRVGRSEGEPALWDDVLRLAVFASDGRTVWEQTPPRRWELPAGVQPREETLSAVALAGVRVTPPRARPGATVTVELVWRAEARLARDWSVFLHLVAADGKLIAQHDGPPLGGVRPTSSWEAGEYLVDPRRLPLPSDLPPGEYQLIAGLYDPLSGERLVGNGRDALLAGTLSVGR
ncbi:MAG: DUF2079 domain-containing protein [Chloroflexi bacterium]|nr:DUF2079 domain-containing protein [Chloroflexota bacterium]